MLNYSQYVFKRGKTYSANKMFVNTMVLKKALTLG